MSLTPVKPHIYVDYRCIICGNDDAIWDGTIATGFAGGSGTEDDPYLIHTGAQLAYLAYGINSSSSNTLYDKHYKLINNISLNNLEWDPIGCYYYGNSSSSHNDNRSFFGSFDGNGYTVSDFKITTLKYNYYECFGLFGCNQGVVENLGVENFVIDVNSVTTVYAGGLVGWNKSGTITDCYSTGNVTALSTGFFAYAGGLAGSSYQGVVTECYSTGNVSTLSTSYSAYAGGLVGRSYGDGTTVTSCYATGDVDATTQSSSTSYSAYAGGLVGQNYSGEKIITNSYATGNVSALATNNSNAYAGGFVGYNGGIVTNCYRYEGQVIKAVENGVESGATNTEGTACTLDQLDSADFYTTTLGWDAEVWDFSNLDFANGKYPVLKSEN